MDTVEKRNAHQVAVLSADFQPRYEPNKAWADACAGILALPGLRAFWPMSAGSYQNADRTNDIAGQGYHLTASHNTLRFGYDSLAPYMVFDRATGHYLERVDGGAANWADITGTEVYMEAVLRGLTLGGWFYMEDTASNTFISKWTAAGGQRGYWLFWFNGTADYRLGISVDGAAQVFVQSTASAITNDWAFVVGRFDPSQTMDIFVQDEKTTLAAGIPASIFDNTAALQIGARNAGAADLLDGKASLCFLCASLLTDAQILTIFHQTRALYGVR